MKAREMSYLESYYFRPWRSHTRGRLTKNHTIPSLGVSNPRERFAYWPRPCRIEAMEDLTGEPYCSTLAFSLKGEVFFMNHPLPILRLLTKWTVRNWPHPCCTKSREDLNNWPHPCCMKTRKAFPTVFDFLARQGGRSPCWSRFCLHWVDGHALSVGPHFSRPCFVRARINLTNEPFYSTLAFPHKKGFRWGTMLLQSWCF